MATELNDLGKQSQSLLKTGRQLLDGRLYDEALAEFQQALREDPTSASAHVFIATIHAIRGNHQEAVTECQKGLEIDDENTEGHVLLAAMHLADLDYDNADQCCRNALTTKPDHFAAQVLLGSSLRARGDLQGAASNWKAALHREPDHPATWYLLAQTLADLNELSPAMAACAEAIRRNPSSPAAFLLLGRLYEKLEDHTEAENAFQQAASLNPMSLVIGIAKAQSMLRSGSPDRAAHVLEDLHQQFPKSPLPLLILGDAKMELRNYSDAIMLYGEAIKQSPSLAIVYYKMGLAKLAAGRRHEAMLDFKEAFRRNPMMLSADFEAKQLAGAGPLSPRNLQNDRQPEIAGLSEPNERTTLPAIVNQKG